MSDHDIQLAALALDDDGNGLISYSEWLEGMRTQMDIEDYNPMEATRCAHLECFHWEDWADALARFRNLGLLRCSPVWH